MVIELAQEVADERGFPTSDFASDHSKAGAVHDAELKHGER